MRIYNFSKQEDGGFLGFICLLRTTTINSSNLYTQNCINRKSLHKKYLIRPIFIRTRTSCMGIHETNNKKSKQMSYLVIRLFFLTSPKQNIFSNGSPLPSKQFPPLLIISNQDMVKRKILSSYLIFFHISTFLSRYCIYKF